MIHHPALQGSSASRRTSREAADLAVEILAGEISADDAIDRTARYLLRYPRVEVVVSALTSFQPEDTEGWKALGERAWIREWTRPGSGTSVLPPPGAGPEAALTMPWMSQLARSGDVVAITDRDLLPAEADQDRTELARTGLRSLVASAYTSRGEMYGSLSAVSTEAGRWSEQLLQDFRVLNAAIISRLAFEHSRRLLAEVIETGAGAQLAAQQLFGAVGHELRTPLAAILGYTEGLLDDARHGAPEVVADGMRRDGPAIVRSCEHLLTIVDSLLGAGRALATDDLRQEVRVSDAVADVVHWHRVPARAARVDVQAVIDADLSVWAHPSGVRQVLTNLLGNAIAHHHAGGGSVHLTATRLLGESGRPMVRVIVRDDGPGLTSEQLSHVFEPFVRFSGSAPGSGLGLPLSRSIAERDGGAVRGESTPGAGATFWLELPAFHPRDE